VRFVLKYKHADGSLTLRATNDELWLLYKTDQASDMRRLEAVHLWLLAAMCDTTPEALADVGAPPDEEQTVEHGRRRGKKNRRKAGGGQ